MICAEGTRHSSLKQVLKPITLNKSIILVPSARYILSAIYFKAPHSSIVMELNNLYAIAVRVMEQVGSSCTGAEAVTSFHMSADRCNQHHSVSRHCLVLCYCPWHPCTFSIISLRTQTLLPGRKSFAIAKTDRFLS